jgi:hypothetical protein
LFASFHTSNRCSQLAYISSNSLTKQVLHRDPDPDEFVDAGSKIYISVKSWIRNRIHIEVKTRDLERLRLKMEPWRAVNAHNGGVEAHNSALEGL